MMFCLISIAKWVTPDCKKQKVVSNIHVLPENSFPKNKQWSVLTSNLLLFIHCLLLSNYFEGNLYLSLFLCSGLCHF